MVQNESNVKLPVATTLGGYTIQMVPSIRIIASIMNLNAQQTFFGKAGNFTLAGRDTYHTQILSKAVWDN